MRIQYFGKNFNSWKSCTLQQHLQFQICRLWRNKTIYFRIHSIGNRSSVRKVSHVEQQQWRCYHYWILGRRESDLEPGNIGLTALDGNGFDLASTGKIRCSNKMGSVWRRIHGSVNILNRKIKVNLRQEDARPRETLTSKRWQTMSCRWNKQVKVE